jgi:drug/metabolite transporter (DMT)-like permease
MTASTSGAVVPSQKLIFGCLASLYLIWGSSYVAFKEIFKTLPPLLSTGSCFAVAGALLLGWGWCHGARPRPRDLVAGALLGTVMIGIATGGVVVGISHLDTSTAALIQASIPMWVALGDRAVFGNRLPGRTIAGLVVGFAGIFSLVGLGGGHDGAPLRWVIVILLASIAWAGGILASRVLVQADDLTIAVGLQLLIGGVLLVAGGALHGDFAARHVDHIGLSSALAWVYLLVSDGLFGYCVFMWLIPRAPSSLVATANYVDPIVALVLGWAVLHEVVAAHSLLAAAVILAGVVLIVSSNHPVSSSDPVSLSDPVPASDPVSVNRRNRTATNRFRSRNM